MNLITALEIASNYPNGDILIEALYHQDLDKWTSIMYLKRGGHIHKTMLSFDISEKWKGFDTEKEAILKMEEVMHSAIKYVKDNSNSKE